MNALLSEGKVEEAREELERLVMEGVNSGPGMEATETFWEELKADLHRESSSTDE